VSKSLKIKKKKEKRRVLSASDLSRDVAMLRRCVSNLLAYPGLFHAFSLDKVIRRTLHMDIRGLRAAYKQFQ
jgi:hypothetical protein